MVEGPEDVADIHADAFVVAGRVGKVAGEGFLVAVEGKAYQAAPEQALASLDSIRRTTLITAPRFDYVHDSIHSVPKRVFSFAMLRIQDNFSNLPLFISEVSWILTHNLN